MNGVRKRRLIAKETSIANCEVFAKEKITEESVNFSYVDEKHRIAVQGTFAGIIIKAGGSSVKVTVLLFAFAFFFKSTRKTGVLARWLFAVC